MEKKKTFLISLTKEERDVLMLKHFGFDNNEENLYPLITNRKRSYFFN